MYSLCQYFNKKKRFKGDPMYFVKEYFEEMMQKEQGRSNRSQEYASLPGEAAKTVFFLVYRPLKKKYFFRLSLLNLWFIQIKSLKITLIY